MLSHIAACMRVSVFEGEEIGCTPFELYIARRPTGSQQLPREGRQAFVQARRKTAQESSHRCCSFSLELCLLLFGAFFLHDGEDPHGMGFRIKNMFVQNIDCGVRVMKQVEIL